LAEIQRNLSYSSMKKESSSLSRHYIVLPEMKVKLLKTAIANGLIKLIDVEHLDQLII